MEYFNRLDPRSNITNALSLSGYEPRREYPETEDRVSNALSQQMSHRTYIPPYTAQDMGDTVVDFLTGTSTPSEAVQSGNVDYVQNPELDVTQSAVVGVADVGAGMAVKALAPQYFKMLAKYAPKTAEMMTRKATGGLAGMNPTMAMADDKPSSIVDDIFGSFDMNRSPIAEKVIKTPKQTVSTTPNRIEIQGKKPEGFADYLGQNELQGKSLDDIVMMFSKENKLARDNVIKTVKVRDIDKFKEFSRDPKDASGWTGKSTGDEFMELKNSIRKEGIKNPITLDMERLPDGNIRAWVGEGNHRLRAARELGINDVPVRFSYRK